MGDTMNLEHIAYIRRVLERFEGNKATGYVPKDRHGKALDNSGVTVGVGIDLGQQTPQGLAAMGLPLPLVEKLKPYCGKRKDAAIRYLQSFPLVLSRAEVDTLNAVVIGAYVRQTANSLDSEPTARKIGRFADRPRQVQGVLVSLLYQWGSPRRIPSTWGKIARGDYAAAVAELYDPNAWNNKYMIRRRGEAGILAEVLR